MKNTYGASFDCNAASSFAEKTICSNIQLSELDDQLSIAYTSAVRNANNKDNLKFSQMYWLQDVRNKCDNSSCIQNTYISRISWLNNAYLSIGYSDLNSVTGKYVRYFHGEPTNDGSDSITLNEIGNRFVRIHGYSYWVGNREMGEIHTGEAEGVFVLNGNNIFFEQHQCSFKITFTEYGLDINDDSGFCGGMNVSFDGMYRKKLRNDIRK